MDGLDPLQDQDRILLITQDTDYDLATEAAAMVEDVLAMLNAATERIIIIVDTRAHNMSNMNDVMVVSKLARSEAGKAVVKHPRLLKSLVITNNPIARLVMKGINSASFGHIETILYETLDEAINDARTVLQGA
jgi:hypothetical protein